MKRGILILFVLGIVAIFAAGCGTSSGKGILTPGYLVLNASNDTSYKPINANVYIGNTLSGTTPEMLTLNPGNYQLKLTASGFDNYSKSITIVAGNTSVLNALMSPRCTTVGQSHCKYFDATQGGPAWWQQNCTRPGVWTNLKACNPAKGCNIALGTCYP